MTKEELKQLEDKYDSLTYEYLKAKNQIIDEKNLELEELKETYKLNKLILKDPIKAEKYRIKLDKKHLNRLKNEPPKRGVLEEVGNATTHGVGAIIGIVFLTMMLIASKDNTLKLIASSIYGVCFIFQMLFSCLYHSFRSGSTVKRVFRRFDYSTIYLQLGGTFTPLLLVNTPKNMHFNTVGITLCCVMWSLIILGITFVCIFGPGRIKGLHYSLYFTLGWSALVFIPYWVINNDIQLLIWILSGGVVYTLGMIPFAAFKKKKSAHFIWHFVVLIGAILQFIGIYLYVIIP